MRDKWDIKNGNELNGTEIVLVYLASSSSTLERNFLPLPHIKLTPATWLHCIGFLSKMAAKKCLSNAGVGNVLISFFVEG